MLVDEESVIPYFNGSPSDIRESANLDVVIWDMKGMEEEKEFLFLKK